MNKTISILGALSILASGFFTGLPGDHIAAQIFSGFLEES